MKKATIPWLVLAASPAILMCCVLFGSSGWGIPATRGILLLRVSRVIAGFVVGAALSCAGVILQALLRNPLAEPYILGVSGGAGLGAAVAILSGLTTVSVAALPVVAFVSAALSLALVYALASRRGSVSVFGLILSGVIVSSMCSSILMFLVSAAPTRGLHSITWWMLGNLQVTSQPLLLTCSAVIVVGLFISWLLARDLNALTLGRDMAHFVGVRTSVAVSSGLILATILAATSVSLAGLIGFVGLIVPHVTRSFTGSNHRRLIPFASLAGGLFLAVSDVFARSVLLGREIPIGVITSLVGGPFFLAILRKRRNQGWIE